MKKLVIITLTLSVLVSMLLLVSCGNQNGTGTGNDDPNNQQNPPSETLDFPNDPSEGFEFTAIDDKTCMITGIGNCTDTMVRIPSEIGDLEVTAVYGGFAWKRAEPIKGIMFPDTVTKIKTYERSYCFSNSLEKIVLPDTAIEIDAEVFLATPYYSNTQNWKDGALYIGKHLIIVKYEIKDTIIVSDGTLDIASGAFYESSATHVVIPDSVVKINREAFMHCENLTRITIGKGVKYIGESALYNCDSLRRIAYTGTETEWGSIEKNSIRGGTTPTDYEVIYNWSDTTVGGSTVPGTTDAKYFTFELNDDNVSYTVKVNKDYIGEVTEYHIPAEYEGLPVTKVGSFGGLKNVTTITMPDSVTSVDAFAFSNNLDLTTIKLSSNLSVLSEKLCSGCEKLNNVVIPASVTQIESHAFGSCLALSDIRFEGTVAQWVSVIKGEWWYYGVGDTTPAETITCSDGVAALFSSKITETEWEEMLEYKNFKNVTINVDAEFSEGWESDDPTYNGTIKIAGDVIKVYGELLTSSDDVRAYKDFYINFITELVKDFEKFEYDEALALYVSKESISYSVSLSYPADDYTERATITATDVKIELDDAKRISKITVSMSQEIWIYDELYAVFVLDAVITLSDYGSTTMQ